MTALSDLQECMLRIELAGAIGDHGGLLSAIDDALGLPAPSGSPSVIAEQGTAYVNASRTCGGVSTDLRTVARNQVPAAWKGNVAETACQAVDALSAEVETTQHTLNRAGHALAIWSDDLGRAQRMDGKGRDQLNSAKSSGFSAAVNAALAGIASMVDGAHLAQTSGADMATLLNQLADLARAERVDGSGLDPVDAVVLAAQLKAACDGGGDILTVAQLERASQLMNSLSAAQLAALENLLANAKSPQEAAYLMKAVAAGYSLSDVQKFDGLIHPYGNDPTWLSDHLAPDLTDAAYDGQSVYGQGSVEDCVAASTVVAAANLDPVLMLYLTTGNNPGALGTDGAPNFQQRLQNVFISNYVQGQRADGDFLTYPMANNGLGSNGVNTLANSDLGKATDSQYQYVSMNGSSDNQAVLPKIEHAVDSGKPVPLDVTNGHVGHQMVIIGHDGNMLEIYNPWGRTSWVSESQFINNNMAFLTTGASGAPNGLPTVSAVEVPST